MQILCNHKSPISLPRVLDAKGKQLFPPLKLKPGTNTVDAKHFKASCDAANKPWLTAMFERGAMRKDGKPTLEVIGGAGDPVAGSKRRSAKEMIVLVRNAPTLDDLDPLWDEENGDDAEPRASVAAAFEKRAEALRGDDEGGDGEGGEGEGEGDGTGDGTGGEGEGSGEVIL